MRDSIIFYLSHYEIVKQLDNEHFGMLYRALFETALGNTPKIDKSIEIPFGFIQNQVVLDKTKYDEKCYKNKVNGKLGGRPKKDDNEETQKPKKANGFFENPNDNENDNENENKNDNENGNGNDNVGSVPSVPPIIFDDVFKYGASLGVGKSYSKKFFDYYEKRGWLNNDGKPLDDWQHVFDNWWEKDKSKKAEIKPSWIDKEITGEKATKEEMQAMDELLGKRGKKQ